LIVDNYGALAIPVLLLVIHGPIATNILNIYTFSVATQALDLKIPRRALSLVVGVFSMAVVVVFIYRADFANTLDSFLIGIVAWIATWGAIMLVHYYWILRGHDLDTDKLFDPVGTQRLPAVNWAGMVAFGAGVVMTWLFMYGLVPSMQGPMARAMHGVDLSWLAGGLTSAAVYAVLGPIVARKYESRQVVMPGSTTVQESVA
jgi:purine-cytosine permease-like protein